MINTLLIWDFNNYFFWGLYEDIIKYVSHHVFFLSLHKCALLQGWGKKKKSLLVIFFLLIFI